MKKILLIIACFGLLFLNCQAQKNVYSLPLDSGKAIKGQTFRYMLPTTAFQVTVTVTKVREIKGYYADYAQSLLGLSNVISENRTFYKVKDIALKPVEVPDANHAYAVELSSAQIKNHYLAQLSKDKSLTPTLSQDVQVYTTKSTPIPDFFKNYSDLSYTEMEDSFVETKIIDGVVTQVPANRTKIVSKSNSQKAQEAADLISKSRKDQYALISGDQETAYSGEAVETMLKELKQWEQNYLNLFTGLVLEDEITYTFYVIPDQQEVLPLFSFDQTHGLTVNDLSTGQDNAYMLHLNPLFANGTLQTSPKTTAKCNNGYRYRQGLPVNIALYYQDKETHNFGMFNMYQFGEIQTLPIGQDELDIKSIGFNY